MLGKWMLPVMALVVVGCASASAGPCDGISKTATVSAACCLDYGLDACGAGLICAALDGRTQATCYPEHSRLDATQCSGDVQCVSGGCAAEQKVCKSSFGTLCTIAVGCGTNPAGGKVTCALLTNAEMRCLSVTSTNGNCADATDCASGVCGPTTHWCELPDGSACSKSEACISGLCNGQSYKCTGSPGAKCYKGTDCGSGACGSNNVCNCKPGVSCKPSGAACTYSAECTSDQCSFSKCT